MSWFVHLLVDVGGEQAAGEPRVVRLLVTRAAAVRIDSSSSSSVVAPSHEAADGAGGDAHRVDAGEPLGQRATARTILLTSTGSRSPLRLRTRIGLASPHGVSSAV